MMDVYKAVLPLCAINIIVVLIILFFPATALWLPSVSITK
jgi:TRAP-type mannitol/chloroaromatic compound transport system permease large subunit